MITKFKIFENDYINDDTINDKKYWFAISVDNDAVEYTYNRMKEDTNELYFYNGSKNYIFFLAYMNNKTIKKYNGYIKCGDNIKQKLDEGGDTIPDIGEWIKDYNIKKYSEKFNL